MVLCEKRSSGFPVGKKRFEPLGILVFSVLQIATFSQVRVLTLFSRLQIC